jgi:hypothetical protein
LTLARAALVGCCCVLVAAAYGPPAAADDVACIVIMERLAAAAAAASKRAARLICFHTKYFKRTVGDDSNMLSRDTSFRLQDEGTKIRAHTT